MAKQLETLSVYKVNAYSSTQEMGIAGEIVYKIEGTEKDWESWVSSQKSGKIITLANNHMQLISILKCLKKVMAIITFKNIEESQLYCVFDQTETEYLIFSEANTLETYPKECFLNYDTELINSLSEEQMNTYKMQAHEAQKKYIEMVQLKKDEEEKTEKLKAEQEKQLEEVTKILKSAEYTSQIPYTYTEVYGRTGDSFFELLTAPSEVLYRKNKTTTNVVQQTMAIQKLNTLPLEYLGKIKHIENNLLLCELQGINTELLIAVQETLDLIKLLYQYPLTAENIQKIDDLYDTIDKYIQEVQHGKNVFESTIAKTLSEHIKESIESNRQLIESMTKDYHYMYDNPHMTKERE